MTVFAKRQLKPSVVDALRLPLSIPAGSPGVATLGNNPPIVPGRHEGRTAAHRELHAVFFFLHALLQTRAELFPAILHKSEAPDFLLECADGRILGIEHSDAASEADQKWMGVTSREAGSRLIPGQSGADDTGGWVGAAPERAWHAALATALRRKNDPKFWRCAPAAERWLLLYDQVLAPTSPHTRLPVALEVIATAAHGSLHLAIVSGGRVALAGHDDWIAPPDDRSTDASLTDAALESLANDQHLVAAMVAAEAEAAAGQVVPFSDVTRSLDAIIETARRARA